MVSELLIALLLLVLGMYWFRYNCLAILKSRISPDRVQQVAAANELGFPEAESRLSSAVTTSDLDDLNRGLRRDYKVLTCLLRYTAPTAYTMEQRMLMLDFRLMQMRYTVCRRFLLSYARRSLAECTRILIHFANTMGERSATVRA